MSATRSAAPSGASHLQWGGRHCDLACPRVLARSMIATKYRLFSAEPKATKFPRYAHTEEGRYSGFRLGSPRDQSRVVDYRTLSAFPGGLRPGHPGSGTCPVLGS